MGIVSDLCAEFVKEKETVLGTSEKNIVEFCESPWGLGLGCTPEVPSLFPTQKFVLKCYYGIKLDNSSNRNIVIKDQYNEKTLYLFNEQEYYQYLQTEGRINLDDGDIGKARPNLTMVIGRRGSKTSLVSFIIAYEAYRLLNKYSPQEYYGILPEDKIKIACVSTSKDTASEMFDRVIGHIERCDFFKKFRTKPTQSKLRLRTQRDMDLFGPDGNATLEIVVNPCSAKGLRGRNNIIVVLDEMAFFFKDKSGKNSKGNSDKDDRTIYEAVTPSVAGFKKRDGTPDGKIICISSPGAKQGKFYEEYDRSFNPDNEDQVCIQAPTWEINTTISDKYLKSKHQANPLTYKSEFGAQFSDQLTGWVDDKEIIYQNVVPGLRYKERSLQAVPHFMGIDIGLKNDGTAIVVCHPVYDIVDDVRVTRFEVDCADIRFAKDEDKETFDPDEIADWISSYTEKYHIVSGLMDQYYHMSIMPKLHGKGKRQFEYRDFNETLNSQIYQNLLTQMMTRSIRLPEGNDGNESDLVTELFSLQAEHRSKYIVRVSAPDRKGAHDDLSDALARSIFIATEYSAKGFGSGRISTESLAASKNYKNYISSEKKKFFLNRPSQSMMRNMANRAGLIRSRRGF